MSVISPQIGQLANLPGIFRASELATEKLEKLENPGRADESPVWTQAQEGAVSEFCCGSTGAGGGALLSTMLQWLTQERKGSLLCWLAPTGTFHPSGLPESLLQRLLVVEFSEVSRLWQVLELLIRDPSLQWILLDGRDIDWVRQLPNANRHWARLTCRLRTTQANLGVLTRQKGVVPRAQQRWRVEGDQIVGDRTVRAHRVRRDHPLATLPYLTAQARFAPAV